MEAMQDMLSGGKLAEPLRKTTAEDLVKQAAAVREMYAKADDMPSRERAAIATLTEAKTVGVDLKNPKQTLEVLNGFEKTVAGTPDEKMLVGDAMLTRVNAHMAMGDLKAATQALVDLLNTTGGEQGADYVRGLLDRLDKDLDKAQAAHDTKTMREVAKSEATLSGFLVDWAKNNPNPEIKNFTYQYMVFDARTKRLAGSLEEDPAAHAKAAPRRRDGRLPGTSSSPRTKSSTRPRSTPRKSPPVTSTPSNPTPTSNSASPLPITSWATTPTPPKSSAPSSTPVSSAGPPASSRTPPAPTRKSSTTTSTGKPPSSSTEATPNSPKPPADRPSNPPNRASKTSSSAAESPPNGRSRSNPSAKTSFPNFDLAALLDSTTQPSPTTAPARGSSPASASRQPHEPRNKSRFIENVNHDWILHERGSRNI